MTFTVESALDAWIDSLPDREPDGMWHPSGLFTCERQAVYARRDTPHSEVRSAASKRPLVVGTALHEMLQNAVSGAPVARVVHEPLVLMPDLKITGHADTLLFFEDETVELVEYKTIKTLKYKNIELPKPEHVAQAMTYAYGIRHYPWYTEHEVIGMGAGTLRRENDPAQITRVRIAYWAKDTHEINETELYPTAEWDRSFLAYMARLNRHMEDNTLPPRKDMVKGAPPKWPCDWCNWRTRCWEEDPE